MSAAAPGGTTQPDKYRVVLEWSQRLEHLLKTRFGATGTGLGEQWRSVQHLLAPDLIEALRKIAWTRNKVAHELDFIVPDLPAFDRMCAQVYDRLLQLDGRPIRPAHVGIRTSKLSRFKRVSRIIAFGWFALFILASLTTKSPPRSANGAPPAKATRAATEAPSCSPLTARAEASKRVAADDPCGARASLGECCPDSIRACRVLQTYLDRECSKK